MPMHFLEAKVFRSWKTCGLKRGVCLALAMLFVLAILVLLVLVVGPQLVESIVTLAEDFSEYLKIAPGVFIRVGTGGGYPNHHPRFTADPKALWPAAQFFAELALERAGA